MRVYHFLPANFALDDIEKHRIKISEIDQLNDPFELWCVSQKDKRLRIGLQRYKEEMSKRYGMLCFSRRWHNPVLWSHYADKHRGICLGFEIDAQGLQAINYVTKRPVLRIPLLRKTPINFLSQNIGVGSTKKSGGPGFGLTNGMP